MKRYVVVLCVLLLMVPFLSMSAYAAAGSGDGSLGGFLLDGLKTLFIPRDDYFPRLQDRLFTLFESKFGNILSVMEYLKTRFQNLTSYRGELMILDFPSDHLFGGAQVVIMEGAEEILKMIRGALSGFFVLCTVAFGYKKVIAMINT